MNEYRITYTDKSGADFFCNITERTEAAARKSFNTWNKKLGHTFQSVELLRTDVCATKQQERDTLETIRKMVEELGPQSYLATAFEGCFEIAEENIENDFADSLKGRLEIAEKRLDEAKADAKAKITALESELRSVNMGIEELIQKDDERKAAMKKMAARTLSPDDMEDVRQLLSDRATEADEAAAKAASEIVKYADQPESKEFQQAVADHRNYTRYSEYTRNILERVVAAQAATQTITATEAA